MAPFLVKVNIPVNMADVVVILVLAFFLVLAAWAVIRDRKNGVPTCGYACGDGVCRGRCGHVNTEHMSRQTRREVKQTIKELKAMQKK